MDSILLITPFRNEEHSIPHYLKALKTINYPPELIDIYWLENDSTDNTLALLQEAKDGFNFNSLTLDSIRILGPVRKAAPSGYWKDIKYSRARLKPWMVIWNDSFFPLIRKSAQDYVLIWYADAIPPPNVIHEYLKVYEEYPAGWVGGSLLRREPRPPHIRSRVESPWPIEVATKNEVTRCELTGHIWLMPRESVENCALHINLKEIHLSIIECLEEKGLYVYYQPSVYMHHISMDGKIHHPEAPCR